MEHVREKSGGRELRRSNALLRMRVGIHYVLFGLLVIIGGWIIHDDIARSIGRGEHVVTILQQIRDHRAVASGLGIVPLACGLALIVTSRFRWFWHLVAMIWGVLLVGIFLAFFAMKIAGYYTSA